MAALVPNRQLVRFEFPLRRVATPPKIDGRLDDWTDDYRLPDFLQLDGLEPFAPVYVAWNEAGLYVACQVFGKTQPLQCDPASFWKGDNLRLCTDMRDARDIKRATRFCQQFYVLPVGGPPDGKHPVAASARIHRARDHAPPVAPGRIAIAARVTKSGYALEAHIPADCLVGFDPAQHRRIGLFSMLEDRDHGQQPLSVPDELNWWFDPSTWPTAVLVD
jgi:hypothetical protein